MTPFHALQQIVKPGLEDTFGASLTANIMMLARNKSGAPIVGMSKDDYLRMVQLIGDDERVTKMWGTVGTREKIARWQQAVDEE